MSACKGILPSLNHHQLLYSQIPVSESPRISITHQLNRRQQRVVLRSRLWVIEPIATAGGGTIFGSDGGNGRNHLFVKNEKLRQCRCYAVGEVEDSKNGKSEEKRSCNRTSELIIAAAFTVVMGVANRVLYKLALVPLKHYPFFLAQLATFGYVLVYFSILYLRYRAGKVTNKMLALPKTPFVAVGLLEALGAACGMAAGANLSGAAIPILSQSFLVWQLLLSFIFLGRRYSFNQLFGCLLVAVGVITTVASGSSAGSLMEAGMFWSLLMIISFLFQAADTVLKEIIFLNATQSLEVGMLAAVIFRSTSLCGLVFVETILRCHLIASIHILVFVKFVQSLKICSYKIFMSFLLIAICSTGGGMSFVPLLPFIIIIIPI